MRGWLACPMSTVLMLFSPVAVAQPSQDLAEQARIAMLQAVHFMHQQVAVHGGYVYQVSADLTLREGEGVAEDGTVWVQPPGTPAVGLALVQAYQRTGEEEALSAARDAAHCLVAGQLNSGGWQAHIDFGEQLRNKMAYRVEGPAKRKAKNISSLDDDKTQSAIRFLATYDSATQFSDEKVHEATLYALDSIVKQQFPNGGFGQVFEHPPDQAKYAITSARYPESWSRQHVGSDYWWCFTLNDNNLARVIDTLLLAAEIYQQPLYRQVALKTADFLLLAQMPEPQPAWAQQYSFDMEPVWARKFEPPAISGGESQEVISTLMNVYEITADPRYLAPIPRALEYLRQSQLEDGRLARFYELKSNRPLFFNSKYELTYEANDLPTHYSFIVNSRLKSLQRRYDQLLAQGQQLAQSSLPPVATSKLKQQLAPLDRPSQAQVLELITSLDNRGAWVENGTLRYHKKSEIKQVIKSETFIRNLDILSRYLAK